MKSGDEIQCVCAYVYRGIYVCQKLSSNAKVISVSVESISWQQSVYVDVCRLVLS